MADKLAFSAARFRAEREGDWVELEALLDRVEKKGPKRLSEAELIALPRLYRATLSSLSIARETSLDASLVAYLEGLSTRAYFILYAWREAWGRKLAGFFAAGWPRAVRGMAGEIVLAFALFVAAGIAGYALVTSDPAWFAGIVDDGMANGRDMQATPQFLRESLYGAQDVSGLEVFATQLFTHNSQVSILAFALGFAFGVPTMLLIAANGALGGAFFAVYVPHGLGWGLLGWLSIHGTTEIFAIVIAGGAGLHIGRAVAFPGERSRLAAGAEAGRRAALAMIGVVVMLLVAGLLEGFARQIVRTDAGRYAIAATMLALWLAYFTLAGRGRHGTR
ncbi:stage II sporulation protein M [Sphingomonas baiyangensis]|uniref:Stage II sporulation protein M n=1 Tax=Sphingomonas baiyangensis TaxID=2572576 RepID=A0A4U1L854_9SPHN|nr:stage II sporulation protein M [Sphingomonas baiyangensis]TKD53132.1 stage II sporulation protein M [Sphingomonas baiyangensis]